MNRFGLTNREVQIAMLVFSGLIDREIAAKLGISEEDVRHHLTAILDKTGVSNRVELARLIATDGHRQA